MVKMSFFGLNTAWSFLRDRQWDLANLECSQRYSETLSQS
jgi:hypothetical protein